MHLKPILKWGGTLGDYPPGYDSIVWHEQMIKEEHLYQAIEEDMIVGGAVLFLMIMKKNYM